MGIRFVPIFCTFLLLSCAFVTADDPAAGRECKNVNHHNITDGRDPVKGKLGQPIGYSLVLGFGLAFGLITVGLVYLDQYFFRRVMNSEYFNTAGRSVRTGLTASVIVSQWTWSATLLQSSIVAYKFGIAGPLWYAGGATVQVILFSVIAILVKLRAPTCHTFLEIIRARWGKTAHIVFLVFALATNIIVSSLLILGTSSVISYLTDMNINVATLLIPLGVILYTLAGGLKATFVASYFNTAIILLGLVIIMFKVYVTSDRIGSPSVMWCLLQEKNGTINNAEGGNLENSYLTIYSKGGLFFGLVNLVGNFGTVFIDQSYWQSAIAATPSASWKGYILGGLCWFAIPFALSTSLGLTAVALDVSFDLEQVNNGLVIVDTMDKLMGNSGLALMLVMLFMAVTSSGAAEQIAFSSLVAYDIYRTYINPNCSGQRIISLSRWVILVFGVFMGLFGIVLQQLRINLNFLYLATGIFIGPAVVPVAYSITWGRASRQGAIYGSICGLFLGVIVWLVVGYLATGQDHQSRSITVDKLGRDEVMLAGNLVSILSSAFICTVLSLWNPDDCDWSTTRMIPLIEDDPNAHIVFEAEESLQRALKKICFIGVLLTVLLVIVWPLLTLPARIFSKPYFTFWVVLSFIWGMTSCILMVTLPLVENRHGIMTVVTGGKFVARARRHSGEMDRDESLEDFVIEER